MKTGIDQMAVIIDTSSHCDGLPNPTKAIAQNNFPILEKA